MRKSHRGLTIRILSGLILAWLAFTASAVADVSLFGTIKDNTANPISNAVVQVVNLATQQQASALTDATGFYSLLIAPGTYDVTVSPPAGSNFQTATAPGQVITANTVLNFVLVPPGVALLSGQLLDAQNNVVPNANVYLTPAGTGNSIQHMTDSAGQYSFQVTPGDYILNLNITNWGNVTPPNTPAILGLGTPAPITLTESRVLNLILPLKRVSVHVQDPLGIPVQNVGLTTNNSYNPALEIGGVTFEGNSYYPYSWPPVYTDSNGAAYLWLLPSGPYGKYVITAAPPPENLYAITSVYDVEVINDMSLTIVLTEPVSLSGQLLDAQNNVVPNANVYLTPAGTGNSIQHMTDSAGQYSFQVAPGDYILNLNITNWGNVTPPNTPAILGLGTPAPITLTESRVLNLILPLKRVSVHVQDPLGSPVQNVGLTTNNSYNPALEIGGVTFEGNSYYPYSWPPVYTDSNGTAYLWLLPSGPYGKYVITAAPPPETPYAIFSVYNVEVIQDMSIVVVLELNRPSQNTCPLSHGFWKTHPEFWPLSKLWLGGQSYTQAELLAILGMAVKGDASVILAQQLIATKLNVANGSDPAPVITAVTSADSLFRTLPGRLPYGTRSSSPAGRTMTNLAATLDSYNNGLATPGCVQPIFTKTKTATVVTAPPDPEILQLEAKVMELVVEGVLNKGQGQSLAVKLHAAMRHLAEGNNRGVCNLLQAFLHEMDALAAARILSPEARRGLADAALLILARLRT